MSYRLGFSRLWIFLSVSWIITTVIYLGPSHFEYLLNMGYVKYFNFYVDPTLDDDRLAYFLRAHEGQFEEIINFNGKTLVFTPYVPEDTVEKLHHEKDLIQSIRSDGIKLKVNFILASLFVFCPPIATFFLGLISVWVVMGFRS